MLFRSLEDRDLLREAKAYLQFLGQDALDKQLDEVARTDSPDFELPAASR